jgi:hypothetical protein
LAYGDRILNYRLRPLAPPVEPGSPILRKLDFIVDNVTVADNGVPEQFAR